LTAGFLQTFADIPGTAAFLLAEMTSDIALLHTFVAARLSAGKAWE
jgi:hypothetical protein